MKLRNLEAKYDNLHPTHVLDTLDDEDEKMVKYKQLWDYALSLEANVLTERAKSSMYLKELKKANAAVFRKHRKIQVIQQFFKMFGLFNKPKTVVVKERGRCGCGGGLL